MDVAGAASSANREQNCICARCSCYIDDRGCCRFRNDTNESPGRHRLWHRHLHCHGLDAILDRQGTLAVQYDCDELITYVRLHELGYEKF